MRKSLFTESQIVGILKEGEAGVPIADLVRNHGISRADVFQLAVEVRGHERRRVEAAERTRGGEREVEADVCRARAGERRHQGCSEPKTVTPAARRQAIEVLTTEHRLSVRRACRVVGTGPGGVVCPAGGRRRAGRGSDRGRPSSGWSRPIPGGSSGSAITGCASTATGGNHKRVYRVYHALGLHLPRRTRRSVRRRSAPGPLPPACAVDNPVLHDQRLRAVRGVELHGQRDDLKQQHITCSPDLMARGS